MDRREEDYQKFFKDVSTRVSVTSATLVVGDYRLTAAGFPRPEKSIHHSKAAEADALAAFHLALNLPRHFDDKHCREWHKRLVEQAKALLDLRGIAYEEQEDDGLTQLVIAPLKGRSHLNDFAFDVAHNLGGISFIYSPKDLLKPEGNRARASFHREKNRILLPKGFLDHPRIDDAIYHEVLHAVFHDLLKNGIGSLFHGWVRSLDRKQPMWKSPQYRFRMSLEELATHALNLHLIGEDWKLAIEAADFEAAAAHQKRLRMKANTLCAIGTEAAGVLERALIELELGGALRLEFNRQSTVELAVAPILWARLSFEGVEVKLPLLASESDTLARWQRHGEGERDAATHDEISALFRKRIEMQRKVAGEIAQFAENVLRTLHDWNGAVPDGVPAAFWEALCAPRLLSFQYLRWG